MTDLFKEGFSEEPFLSTLTFSLEGKVFSANLPLPHSRPLTQGNGLYLTSSLLKGEGGFICRTISVHSWCSHSRGEVFSTNLPFPLLRPLTQANDPYLTYLRSKAKEDFTGEPLRSTLAFSLEGEVFSANLPLPHSRPLTQGNKFVTSSCKNSRRYFNQNLLGDLIKKPL